MNVYRSRSRLTSLCQGFLVVNWGRSRVRISWCVSQSLNAGYICFVLRSTSAMALSSQHTEGMCTDANVKMAEIMVVQLQILKLLIFSVLLHFLVDPNIL
jgi:hypothetical protein